MLKEYPGPDNNEEKIAREIWRLVRAKNIAALADGIFGALNFMFAFSMLFGLVAKDFFLPAFVGSGIIFFISLSIIKLRNNNNYKELFQPLIRNQLILYLYAVAYCIIITNCILGAEFSVIKFLIGLSITIITGAVELYIVMVTCIESPEDMVTRIINERKTDHS